jgi:hypothetical protein
MYSRVRGGSKNGVTFLIDKEKDENAKVIPHNSMKDENPVPSSSSRKSTISGQNGDCLDLEFSEDEDRDGDTGAVTSPGIYTHVCIRLYLSIFSVI